MPVQVDVPTFPPLDALAALLALDPDDPADADDLEVLRQLLARRIAVIAAGGEALVTPTALHLVHDDGRQPDPETGLPPSTEQRGPARPGPTAYARRSPTST